MEAKKADTNVQEDFDSHRIKVVRQDRILADESGFNLVFDDGTFPVRDYSALGISFFHHTDWQPPKGSVKVKFMVGDFDIGTAELEFARRSCNDFGQVFSAFRVCNDTLDTVTISAAIDAHRILVTHKKDNDHSSLIPDAFRSATFELYGWLRELELKINKLAPNSFQTGQQEVQSHENAVCELVSSYLAENLTRYYRPLAQALVGADEGVQKASYNFFRQQVGPILYQSYYSHRAFNKPKGYAGDFEMMNTVYQNDSRGQTLFGKCIHKYFVNVPEANAVRNRAEYLKAKITQVISSNPNGCKILSIASGPAQEIQEIVASLPVEQSAKVEFHLLDQDRDALKFSQLKLEHLNRSLDKKFKFEFHRKDIRLLVSEGLNSEDFQLVYSAGLFDYLADPVAVITAKAMMGLTSKNGHVIIGNFNKNIPNEFGMSLIMDWQLIYRSPEELKNLFWPVTQNVDIESEQENVNLFALLRK